MITNSEAGTTTEVAVNPLDQLFGALERGDADAARDSLTDDARVWHNFDRIDRDPEEAHSDWSTMISRIPARKAVDVQRSATDDGFVQRHTWVMSIAPGQEMAFHVCVVVVVKDGKIFRLYEYLDRAAHFTPDSVD